MNIEHQTWVKGADQMTTRPVITVPNPPNHERGK